jgi:hypothetical protein
METFDSPAVLAVLLSDCSPVVGDCFRHSTRRLACSPRCSSLASNSRAIALDRFTDERSVLMASLGLCGVAASIRPRVELVLGAIGAAGALTAVVILTKSFYATAQEADALEATSIERVTALGLNPNYLRIVLAMGIVAVVGLAVHLKPSHIGGVPASATLPALKCDRRSCSSRSVVRRHIRRSRGASPHHCDSCDRSALLIAPDPHCSVLRQGTCSLT